MAKKKHTKSPTSRMAQVLAPYFDDLAPDEFSDTSCPSKCFCNLAAGIEHLFVFHTALAVFGRIKKKSKSVMPSQVIYTPHPRSEKGGFDLSLGVFDKKHRVLLMHKLKQHCWCDAKWRWNSATDQASHGQIIKLLDNYLDDKRRLPFLVLHVCYCVHEYRRMGRKTKGIDVPAFSDLTRSMFVNLVPIIQEKNWRHRLQTRQVHVEVTHEEDADTVRSALIFGGNGEELSDLQAIDLSKFLGVVEKQLA